LRAIPVPEPPSELVSFSLLVFWILRNYTVGIRAPPNFFETSKGVRAGS